MTYSSYLSIFIVGLVFMLAGPRSSADERSFSLTYLNRIKIENEVEGLSEPSGLALSFNGNALWTVSDDAKRIFKISLDGELQKDKSFKIPHKGLEGIALDATGEFLITVREEDNEIIKIKIDLRDVASRQRLADMVGYEAVENYFTSGGANKGLEGITWNTETGTIFVLKEGAPGLLMEVSSDLKTIRSHILLNHENGFLDDEVKGDELDFSGICFDQSRNRFWIVSDKGRRLFLYDWKENEVIQSFPLVYRKKKESRQIEKAEGVAINPDSNRLYVVSDKEALLYAFDLHE